MKKILLLGGSAQQIIAIQTAKELGYYTVLCDYLPDNPGQYVADKFYLESTTNKKAILLIAEKEAVEGVLAYASDPAAPTAAYVAEQMGLAGNPYDSVEILCNKDRFRKFLAENDFYAPRAKGYSSIEEIMGECRKWSYPIIIKPVDSSGSKGVTVLNSSENLEAACKFAFEYSRSNRIVIEDYIEKKHTYLIGGDVFVSEGKIVLWGLLNCHRDNSVNELVPVGKSYPLELGEKDILEVKKTLNKIVDKLGIINGSMNVELVVDKQNRVWPIDIGPRSGGNMIPDLLGDMFGVDIAKLSVQAAMGEMEKIKIIEPMGCYATHNLHCDKSGIYKGITFSKELERHIYKKYLYKTEGEQIEFFDNASKCLGIIFMKYDTKEEMFMHLEQITNDYKVEFEETKK